MKDNKTIFDYITKIMALYGFIIATFILLLYFFGDISKGYSSLFSLGKQGLPFETLISLLLMSVIVTLIRVLFLSDVWIKNMKLITRNILFFFSIVIVAVCFIFIYEWFPVDDSVSWFSFICCFTVCTILGIFVDKIRERTENRKMDEALQRIQGNR